MGSDWEPEKFHKDPMVDAVYNVAAELNYLARATNGLLYGLKYSSGDGMSIAEAIEVAGKNISEASGTSGTDNDNAAENIASAIRELSEAENIASAIRELAKAVAKFRPKK